MENLIFIYDRTQEDIERRTSKAFINSSDLCRIEKNIESISGYISVPVIVKKDWKIGDIPRSSDYQRIKENTKKIRDIYSTYKNIPEVPERPYNTFQKWNDIEKILHDIFFVFTKSQDNRIYCGEDFSCGDDMGVI